MSDKGRLLGRGDERRCCAVTMHQQQESPPPIFVPDVAALLTDTVELGAAIISTLLHFGPSIQHGPVPGALQAVPELPHY